MVCDISAFRASRALIVVARAKARYLRGRGVDTRPSARPASKRRRRAVDAASTSSPLQILKIDTGSVLRLGALAELLGGRHAAMLVADEERARAELVVERREAAFIRVGDKADLVRVEVRPVVRPRATHEPVWKSTSEIGYPDSRELSRETTHAIEQAQSLERRSVAHEI